MDRSDIIWSFSQTDRMTMSAGCYINTNILKSLQIVANGT